MPKIEVEILRTVTITREENTTVELGVPQSVIDDCTELDWLDAIMTKDAKYRTAEEEAVWAAVTNAEWDVADEDQSVEYDEASNLTD